MKVVTTQLSGSELKAAGPARAPGWRSSALALAPLGSPLLGLVLLGLPGVGSGGGALPAVHLALGARAFRSPDRQTHES